MLLWAVDEPLEIVWLEAFLGERDIERANKGGTGRGILSIYGRLECPARLVNICVLLYTGGH
jgi:hypothetical protein